MRAKKAVPEPPKRGRGRPPKYPGGSAQITVRLSPQVADALARYGAYQKALTGKGATPGDIVAAALSRDRAFRQFLRQMGIPVDFSEAEKE